MAPKYTVNTKISVAEREAIKQTSRQLLYRHLAVPQCPLHPSALLDLWAESLVPTDRYFLDAAKAKFYHDRGLTLPPTYGQGVLLRFSFGCVLLQIPRGVFNGEQMPMFVTKTRPTFNPAKVLSPEKCVELEEWAKLTVHIYTRVVQTRATLSAVLGLASTVGQLVRMAPDVVRYTDGLTREALGSQERRSPLPDAWMQMDRLEVEAAQGHLAFCYLLPPDDTRDLRSPTVWCWTKAGHADAIDNTFPPDYPNTKFPELSDYLLPRSANPLEFGTFYT